MPAAITNTAKYYKTKSSPTVYNTQGKAYSNEQDFFKDSGFKNWDEANKNIEVVGNVYKSPTDKTVYEYNPYTGKSTGFSSEDAFKKAGYNWGDVTTTTQNPSLLFGQKTANGMNPTEAFIQAQGANIPSAQTAYQASLDAYKTQLK